jgi:hypothetical protein
MLTFKDKIDCFGGTVKWYKGSQNCMTIKATQKEMDYWNNISCVGKSFYYRWFILIIINIRHFDVDRTVYCFTVILRRILYTLKTK